MLDHESIVPLYEQIVDTFKHDIENGKYNSQRRLPTEDELSTQYNVSRITIRRAISELVDAGLVEKKQGKGTFVCAPKMHKSFNRPGTSFSELCALNGVKPGAKVLKVSVVPLEDPIGLKYLELEKGTPVVQIDRLRYADGKPLVMENNYFPMEYAYLMEMDLQNDSIYRFLREQKGESIIAGDLLLRIERTDAATSKLLEVSRNTPMLRMTGCTRRADGKVLHSINNIGYGENFDFIVR